PIDRRIALEVGPTDRPDRRRRIGRRLPARKGRSRSLGDRTRRYADVAAREPAAVERCAGVVGGFGADVLSGAVVDFGERVYVDIQREQQPAALGDPLAEEERAVERDVRYL